ncbi:MAG: outer membrane lipoprotein-sorting protein [Bdellovibrionales bacterium]|nr:outer membrane lipoprotein-sorting protein [Bdellovibrionales bacterium]
MRTLLCLLAVFSLSTQATTTAASSGESDAKAVELIRKLERNSRGETFSGDMNMTVDHRGNARKLSIRVWSRGQERVLLRVLEPARDKGTGNLRIKADLWQYLPRVEKTIKVPSSLLFQSWMGSDFSNDDLVKSSHLERDYVHKYIGEESVGDIKAVKIEGMPKPESKIVWGKVIFWVTPKDGALVQQEFYTEAGKLVKQLRGTDHKTFGKYVIPTRLTMRDLTRENSSTEIVYGKVEFDKPLADNVFTLKELEKALP